MRTIYYYELVLSNQGKKKLTEHVKLDYAVSSAESEADILTGHTWDRCTALTMDLDTMAKSTSKSKKYSPRRQWVPKYEVKRNCTADLTKVRDAYY